jgi:hypothetical protein
MTRTPRIVSTCAAAALLVAAVAALAQFDGGGYFRRGRRNEGKVPLPADRNDVPTWQADAAFKHDVFTFVRVKYDSDYGYRRRGGGGWLTDWPDSDLNFSFRLQQLTSLKVEPNPIQLELTDDALFDYPFIYMLEPGALVFTDAEVAALRRYLFNGGFLMVDDFWGDDEYENFYREIKRVFPDRELVDVPLTHPIYHAVYDMPHGLPKIHEHDGKPARGFGIFVGDRLAVYYTYSSDLGNGWEDPETYHDPLPLHEAALRMGINLFVYAVTSRPVS